MYDKCIQKIGDWLSVNSLSFFKARSHQHELNVNFGLTGIFNAKTDLTVVKCHFNQG